MAACVRMCRQGRKMRSPDLRRHACLRVTSRVTEHAVRCGVATARRSSGAVRTRTHTGPPLVCACRPGTLVPCRCACMRLRWGSHLGPAAKMRPPSHPPFRTASTPKPCAHTGAAVRRRATITYPNFMVGGCDAAPTGRRRGRGVRGRGRERGSGGKVRVTGVSASDGCQSAAAANRCCYHYYQYHCYHCRRRW